MKEHIQRAQYMYGNACHWTLFFGPKALFSLLWKMEKNVLVEGSVEPKVLPMSK